MQWDKDKWLAKHPFNKPLERAASGLSRDRGPIVH